MKVDIDGDGKVRFDEFDHDPYSTVMVGLKALLDYGINNGAMSETEQGILVNIRDKVLSEDADVFR